MMLILIFFHTPFKFNINLRHLACIFFHTLYWHEYFFTVAWNHVFLFLSMYAGVCWDEFNYLEKIKKFEFWVKDLTLWRAFNICGSLWLPVSPSLSLSLSFSTSNTSKTSVSRNRMISTFPLLQHLGPDFCTIIKCFLYYQKTQQ